LLPLCGQTISALINVSLRLPGREAPIKHPPLHNRIRTTTVASLRTRGIISLTENSPRSSGCYRSVAPKDLGHRSTAGCPTERSPWGPFRSLPTARVSGIEHCQTPVDPVLLSAPYCYSAATFEDSVAQCPTLLMPTQTHTQTRRSTTVRASWHGYNLGNVASSCWPLLLLLVISSTGLLTGLSNGQPGVSSSCIEAARPYNHRPNSAILGSQKCSINKQTNK
jgi:hypothetical protein